jgi:hypothetical protein
MHSHHVIIMLSMLQSLTGVALQAFVLGTIHSIEMSLRLVRCLA